VRIDSEQEIKFVEFVVDRLFNFHISLLHTTARLDSTLEPSYIDLSHSPLSLTPPSRPTTRQTR